MDGFANVRVQVHGINKVHLRVLLCQVLYGVADVEEAITEVFTPMASNKHQSCTVVQTCYIVAFFFQFHCQTAAQCVISLYLFCHPV